MKRDDYTKSNRDAWNEVADKHKSGNWTTRVNNFRQKGYSSLDREELNVLNDIVFSLSEPIIVFPRNYS